jgi:WD40 repeat protein
MGLIALAAIGLMALARDDPGRESPPTRLVPGEPGMMALGFTLSPDGKLIATMRIDGRVSLRGRGAERLLDPRGSASKALAFSPDGRTLAVGRDEPGILLFDVVGGGSPIILNTPLPLSRALAFSPDGRTLAATTRRDGEILLWDLASDRARIRLHGLHPAVDIAFSPDGRTLAAGERCENAVTLWDLETGRSRCLLSGRFGAITSVAFSPDGGLLAAAGPADRLVRLWDPASGRLRLRIPGHTFGTNAVRFSPDGGLLVTAGSDGMIRVWRVETGEPVVSLDGRSRVLPQVFLSADGRTLAAGGWCDDDIRVWDLDEIREIPSRGP